MFLSHSLLSPQTPRPHPPPSAGHPLACPWLLHRCWVFSKRWALPGGGSAGRLRGQPLVGARVTSTRHGPLSAPPVRPEVIPLPVFLESHQLLDTGLGRACLWMAPGPVGAVGLGVKAQLCVRQLVSCLMFLFFLLTPSSDFIPVRGALSPPTSEAASAFLSLHPGTLSLTSHPPATRVHPGMHTHVPTKDPCEIMFPLGVLCRSLVFQLHCHMWVMAKSTVGVWG